MLESIIEFVRDGLQLATNQPRRRINSEHHGTTAAAVTLTGHDISVLVALVFVFGCVIQERRFE